MLEVDSYVKIRKRKIFSPFGGGMSQDQDFEHQIKVLKKKVSIVSLLLFCVAALLVYVLGFTLRLSDRLFYAEVNTSTNGYDICRIANANNTSDFCYDISHTVRAPSIYSKLEAVYSSVLTEQRKKENIK